MWPKKTHLQILQTSLLNYCLFCKRASYCTTFCTIVSDGQVCDNFVIGQEWWIQLFDVWKLSRVGKQDAKITGNVVNGDRRGEVSAWHMYLTIIFTIGKVEDTRADHMSHERYHIWHSPRVDHSNIYSIPYVHTSCMGCHDVRHIAYRCQRR